MKTIATVLLLLLAQFAAADGELDAVFDRDVLLVLASKHACYRLDIYIAESDEQRSRGLMHVRSLPQTTGMLFIYPEEQYVSMWMKNTFIPLDIAFVKADGRVSSIAYSTEPQSLRSIQSLERVQFVLELNAGVAEKLSIDQYSSLYWERDGRDE